MHWEFCLTQLSANAGAIKALVTGVDEAQAHWKPGPNDWSIIEVLNHLADEERDDFRARFQWIINGASGDPPPNDSDQKVTERRYNDRDLAASLADYLNEREQSLKWLRSLTDIPFDSTVTWSWGRTISAGDMFVSWVAHDVLHLRQLTELKWGYQATQFGGYDPGYAGDW